MNPFYTLVSDRAAHRCEYCHAPELVFNCPFEVEHIIPLYRGGADAEFNLALACRSCNLRKGTRISRIDSESDTEVRLFHPRQDQWDDHFQVDSDSGTLVAKTPIGRVTIAGLEMNSSSTSNGTAAMDSFRFVSLRLPISSSTVASDHKTTRTITTSRKIFLDVGSAVLRVRNPLKLNIT